MFLLTDPSSSWKLISVNYLFSSQLGVSVITESLHQFAVVRFSMCRNLLLLQHLILECSGGVAGFGGGSWSGGERTLIDEENVRSILMPRATLLTQAYLLLKWVTEVPCAPQAPPANSLENSLQQMTFLHSGDGGKNIGSGGVSSLHHLYVQGRGGAWTLAELFLASEGGRHAHTLLLRLMDVPSGDVGAPG
ncbi:hypothetical protein J437_LFUL002667, partial [Ladona fulva]